MNYYFNSPYYYSNTPDYTWVGIWAIISIILAIIGAILVYVLFVRRKGQPKNKFLCWLKDFLNFKTMWIELILKITYYVATIFCILYSFALIPFNFLSFLLVLILMPVLIRLIYEGCLIIIEIWKNTKIIAKNSAPAEKPAAKATNSKK